MTDTKKVALSSTAAAVTLGIITSLFIGNRYNPSKGEIVYVDQDDNTFDEIEEFYLKDVDSNGEYTMILGGNINGDPLLQKTFYITKDSKKTIIE